jgi:hypothetical protein
MFTGDSLSELLNNMLLYLVKVVGGFRLPKVLKNMI